MAFNGSGTYTRLYNWVTDRGNGVKIRADKSDEELDGIAAGLSNCVCRDGQSTISANIPFNNKKITGLGDASAATDALNRQTADARYIRSAVDLTGESAVADADVFPFYDDSAAAMRKVTYSQLKTDLVAETNFIPANKVINTAAGTISATTVQAAIDELDTEKAPTSRTLTAAGLVTGGGTLASDRTFTVTAATQANQETGTAVDVAVTSGRQHFHPSAAKSFLSMNGTGTIAINRSTNVSSITDNGTGDYTDNFTTAHSAADYALAYGSQRNGSPGNLIVGSENTGGYYAAASFRFSTLLPSSGTAVDAQVACVTTFGDL